jgi:hypothetical protein
MKLKFTVAILILWLGSLPVHGATINAPSCSVSDVQSAINSASSGDTVVVPSGSCTWSTQVAFTKGITLQGQTACTGSGDPYGSTSGVITCTDGTNITLTYTGNGGTLYVTSASATNFVTITGFTFIVGASNSSGQVRVSGTHGQVSFRIHHNHFQWISGGRALWADTGYGLIDHVFWDDTNPASGSGAGGPLDIGGWRTGMGYYNWNDPTNFGSNQAIYVEQCYYLSNKTSPGTEGFYDAYYGAKIVNRFNTIVGNQAGGWHGTDSGGFRSGVYGEEYFNSISNSTGTTLWLGNMRGGTILLFDNTVGGSTKWTSGWNLQYYRWTEVYDIGWWGSAAAGLNWTPMSSDPTNANSEKNTLNASDWQANYSYAAQAYIGPTSNNAGSYNYQDAGACTSGGTRPSFNQTEGGTTTGDGTCTWTNVGGVLGTSPGGAGFCAANPDTACSSDPTCSALSPGDTCSRYFDTNGGVYPYRDQPGRAHNQVSAPAYEWGNSGSGLPSPILFSSASAIVVENRDYYQHNNSFDGTSGVGVGTLANRPSTCTPRVAYWATDQGSWNQSGNGQGNGVFYQCTAANTWSVYYTPYTYPDPLEPTSAQQSGIGVAGGSIQ